MTLACHAAAHTGYSHEEAEVMKSRKPQYLVGVCSMSEGMQAWLSPRRVSMPRFMATSTDSSNFARACFCMRTVCQMNLPDSCAPGRQQGTHARVLEPCLSKELFDMANYKKT